MATHHMPSGSWQPTLQNSNQFLQPLVGSLSASPMLATSRSTPPLPPRPQGVLSNYNSSSCVSAGYSPYGPGYGSSYGYNSNYYGGTGNYYRSPMSYGGGYGGGYNSYGGGYGSGFGGINHDTESRFVQYAEQSSRNTFESVENIVRAFGSMASMLDNTFFALTSSFRAILSVAENFGRLRSTFGQMFHYVNVFRLFAWFYRTFLRLVGWPVSQSRKSAAWSEAVSGIGPEALQELSAAEQRGQAWPVMAFLGAIIAIPYLISKYIPKYEDKYNPQKWKADGIPAKVCFDFSSNSTNELTIHLNDEILLAPKSIQQELGLTNSGWAYAVCKNGKCGAVPLNYIVIVKKNSSGTASSIPSSISNSWEQNNLTVNSEFDAKVFSNGNLKTEKIKGNEPTKRVTFDPNLDKLVPKVSEQNSVSTNQLSVTSNE